ncbi:MAG: hypothetical protein EOO28_32660 [Comamonadaceae bacterium]|nr:MAG: hypothetical protein EOO28_32660 [Comamonadaceae bacterium]
MIPVHVVARSRVAADLFLENHSFLAHAVRIETNQKSFFSLINSIVATASEDVVCIVHDDVFLPTDFEHSLRGLVLELSRYWSNWGLVGNAGVTSLRYGYRATNVVRYLADPHGGPNLAGYIVPAQSVDGNVMLLNVAAMREKRLQLPDFDGFQLYDIILSIESLYRDLLVLIAPQLACWHGSRGNQLSFDEAASSTSFENYLQSRLVNRKIQTLNGEKKVPLPLQIPFSETETRIDLFDRGLASCAIESRVTIVIRTKFERPALLTRCLDSVKAFIAETDARLFDYVLASSVEASVDFESYNLLKIDVGADRDSRFQLVQYAAQQLDSTYLWFLDDDDWLFPNAGSSLTKAIRSVSSPAVFFLDTQHFTERVVPGSDGVYEFSSEPGRFFSCQDHFQSLSGSNHSPFCSVIFPRTSLLEIPSSAYDSVVYFEDYMCVLNIVSKGILLSVSLSVLCVGISIRDSGNSVTMTDRSVWNRSMANVVSLVARDSRNVMYSVPLFAKAEPVFVSSTVDRQVIEDLQLQLRKAFDAIDEYRSSSSWKITSPFRRVKKLWNRIQGKVPDSTVSRRF